MTDICSIWAYEDIKASGYLGRRQAQVLSIFAGSPNIPFRATEIVEMNGRTVSETTRTRISELEAMGFLEKVDIVVCPLTRKKVNRWKWTGNKRPTSEKKECRVTCPTCKGAGSVTKKMYVPNNQNPPPNDLFDTEV